MRHVLATLATLVLAVVSAAPAAAAFDPAIEAVIDRHKAGKPVSIGDVAALMSASERWCYAEQEGTCSWSDIYLDVTDAGATFEIGNAWNADVDILFTDAGLFRDNAICETGDEWVSTVRAQRRSDGSALAGRELWALKQEITTAIAGGTVDCFDYRYLSADEERQTVTLLQRQTTEGVHEPANDTEVTLHFDPATAAALTWRW